MLIPPVPVSTSSTWPLPKLVLRIDDLDHEGATVFLGAVNPKQALQIAVQASHQWLFSAANPPPEVQQITLVLRSMPGVAHTVGFGPEHRLKEIHFSLDYILHSKDRATAEIMGVLVHEVVHCYQYDGKGGCPGGLTEGIADFVRLKAGYNPPHWRRRGEGTHWDAGYDTTAYFLAWIDETYGSGSVAKLNECMKEQYHKKVFKQLTKCGVKKLWRIYCAMLKDEDPVTIVELWAQKDEEDSDRE